MSGSETLLFLFIKAVIVISLIKLGMFIASKFINKKINMGEFLDRIYFDFNGKKGYIKKQYLSKVPLTFSVNWENTFAFVLNDNTQKVITSKQEYQELMETLEKRKTTLFVFHQSDVIYE